MKGYYTSGEFAKKANVSTRTIRYYDNENILKPSLMSEAGYRLYTDSDFAKLQKILTLRYLGFSLEEIRTMTINDEDTDYIGKSMQLQLKLVRKRMEDLKQMEQTLLETSRYMKEEKQVDWNKILHLIHISNMERTLVEQYKTAENLNIRIDLHKRYSQNHQGWYPWIFENLQVREGMRVLDLGCGNASLWSENKERIPKNLELILADISRGMLEDAKESVKGIEANITYLETDSLMIPLPDQSVDVVTANHVLFYIKDIDRGLKEVRRILKPDGVFFCSTYGKDHMKEITQLVREFDSKITLSEVNLYDIFGLEDGKKQLEPFFSSVEQLDYEDSLLVDDERPLIDYILSCHGNQQECLSGRYEEFRVFLKNKIARKGNLKITKCAGMFRCRR